MRRLIRLVALSVQELETVIDKREVQEETVARQAVPAVTDDLHAAFGVVAVEAGEDFVVGEAVALFYRDSFGSPFLDQGVVILDSFLVSLATASCLPRLSEHE